MSREGEECKIEDEARRIIETSSSEEIKEVFEDNASGSSEDSDERSVPKLHPSQMCPRHN